MKSFMKKGVLGLAVTGLLAVPLSTSAFANVETFVKSEIVNENDGLKASYTYDEKAIPTVTSGKKDGGYWIRGKKGSSVYSKYKHYTKEGHASVVNGEGDEESGGWKPKDIYSKADLPWTSKGTNKAYYNYR